MLTASSFFMFKIKNMSIKIGNLDIQAIKVGSADCKVYIGNELLYPNEPPFKNYLRTIAVTNGKIGFGINKNVAPTAFTSFSYSLDSGETWTTVNNSASTIVQVNLDVVAGDVIYWKGDAKRLSTGASTYQYSGFFSTADFNAEGNVMSMLYGDDFEGQTDLIGNTNSYAFANLFYGASHLINAENLVLPATVLAQSCYASMFQNCTSLTTVPELPATALASSCYYNMFFGCTSLTTAPTICATTMATSACTSMFNGCTSLTTAPALLATTLADSCYANMFGDCRALTTAPSLPATTLANNCYWGMFWGCRNLNNVTCLATDISATNCTYYWLNNVAATGTFTKAVGMNDWSSDQNGIPENWTVQDA